jgi:Golgi apparatus protein 1
LISSVACSSSRPPTDANQHTPTPNHLPTETPKLTIKPPNHQTTTRTQQNTANRPGGVFTIGAAGHCLSKALVEARPLQPECRSLVLVAAPKDSRSFLQYPESTNALVKRLADVQRAAGLEGVLLDVYDKSGSTVTVTGWVALACIVSIVLVSMGSVVVVVRRMTGVDKPHTQYVKSGDA